MRKAQTRYLNSNSASEERQNCLPNTSRNPPLLPHPVNPSRRTGPPQPSRTIEETATVTNSVGMGEGKVIHGRTAIRCPVIIGEYCEIGPDTYIGPYTSIGDHTTINNTENRTRGRTMLTPGSDLIAMVAL